MEVLTFKPQGVCSREMIIHHENGIIVEKPVEKRIALSRRLEAYALFVEMNQADRNFTIDNIPLNKEECNIFITGIETLIDLIKKLRSKRKKEE